MKFEWNFNETSLSRLKQTETGKFVFFRNFASLRSRQGHIFHSILIGFIALVAEVWLAILTYQEFLVMLRLLTVATLSSTIFEFMDCVE